MEGHAVPAFAAAASLACRPDLAESLVRRVRASRGDAALAPGCPGAARPGLTWDLPAG